MHLLAKGVPHEPIVLCSLFQKHTGPLARPRAATHKLYTAPNTPTAANPIDRNICRGKHVTESRILSD